MFIWYGLLPIDGMKNNGNYQKFGSFAVKHQFMIPLYQLGSLS